MKDCLISKDCFILTTIAFGSENIWWDFVTPTHQSTFLSPFLQLVPAVSISWRSSSISLSEEWMGNGCVEIVNTILQSESLMFKVFPSLNRVTRGFSQLFPFFPQKYCIQFWEFISSLKRCVRCQNFLWEKTLDLIFIEKLLHTVCSEHNFHLLTLPSFFSPSHSANSMPFFFSLTDSPNTQKLDQT